MPMVPGILSTSTDSHSTPTGKTAHPSKWTSSSNCCFGPCHPLPARSTPSSAAVANPKPSQTNQVSEPKPPSKHSPHEQTGKPGTSGDEEAEKCWMLCENCWWTGFLMKRKRRKHGKNRAISPPQGGHQACQRPTFLWARGGHPPGAGPAAPRHRQKTQTAHKGPPLWKMMPQSAAWAIQKAHAIWGAQQKKVTQRDRQTKMELCPPMNPGTTHCKGISPLEMQ